MYNIMYIYTIYIYIYTIYVYIYTMYTYIYTWCDSVWSISIEWSTCLFQKTESAQFEFPGPCVFVFFNYIHMVRLKPFGSKKKSWGFTSKIVHDSIFKIMNVQVSLKMGYAHHFMPIEQEHIHMINQCNIRAFSIP